MHYGQVYRFGDLVSVSIPRVDGNTYISAGEARKLAAALYRVARSVEQENFVDSACTQMVDFDRVDRYREVRKPRTQRKRRSQG